MNRRETRADLATMGISLTWDAVEYRVNYKGGREDTAYYTDDLVDAWDTGVAMAKGKANGQA